MKNHLIEKIGLLRLNLFLFLNEVCFEGWSNLKALLVSTRQRRRVRSEGRWDGRAVYIPSIISFFAASWHPRAAGLSHTLFIVA